MLKFVIVGKNFGDFSYKLESWIYYFQYSGIDTNQTYIYFWYFAFCDYNSALIHILNKTLFNYLIATYQKCTIWCIVCA